MSGGLPEPIEPMQVEHPGEQGTARLYGAVSWAVWVIWAAVGFDEAVKLVRGNLSLLGYPALPWLAVYAAFAGALWLSNSLGRGYSYSRPRSLLALVAAALCMWVMLYLCPDCDADSFVLVLAWQAGLVLPRIWAITWILLQTILLVVVRKEITTEYVDGWGLAALYWSVQTFAFVTAIVAHREARISQELAGSNAELKATQLMLAQASQLGERVRIARELHDVLGHDLTALGLHLELALNSAAQAPQELRSARALAAGLQSRVRAAVSLLRENGHARLTPILQSLVTDGPGLKIHLAVTDDIDAADAGRAHALMRCLQEIITNARRHSGAANLWLEVRREGDRIVATARDDGRGARARAWLEEPTGPELRQGLRGVHERLEHFGGRLTVETDVGKGFSLEAILPLGVGA